MEEETYEYTPETYERLLRDGIRWTDVHRVLHSGEPVIRRHIGAVLQVVGRELHGYWLAVALIEVADDAYTIVGARYLSDAEIVTVERLMEGNDHE